MNVGILGYGTYIPRFRIAVADIASVWGKQGSEVERSLGILEKSVAGLDEDAVTLAFEAGQEALRHANIPSDSLSSCFVGSESHPYAVNPTATIVAEFLGVGNAYLAADLEFACKAATAGLLATCGLIASGMESAGLVIGSDTAQAKPHDILEYTAAAAAAAFVLGNDANETFATIRDFTSFSSDTPDFWRRDGVRFPTHTARFTGEPAYFTHVLGAARHLLAKAKRAPSDFTYCVFHSPNGKFPREAARRIGFSKEQLAPSLIVDSIGNPYSASSLLGLAAVLDTAKPGDSIFVVSYGSGAGSDAFIVDVRPGIEKKRKHIPLIEKMQQDKKAISYIDYLRISGKI